MSPLFQESWDIVPSYEISWQNTVLPIPALVTFDPLSRAEITQAYLHSLQFIQSFKVICMQPLYTVGLQFPEIMLINIDNNVKKPD